MPIKLKLSNQQIAGAFYPLLHGARWTGRCFSPILQWSRVDLHTEVSPYQNLQGLAASKILPPTLNWFLISEPKTKIRNFDPKKVKKRGGIKLGPGGGSGQFLLLRSFMEMMFSSLPEEVMFDVELLNVQFSL